MPLLGRSSNCMERTDAFTGEEFKLDGENIAFLHVGIDFLKFLIPFFF